MWQSLDGMNSIIKTSELDLGRLKNGHRIKPYVRKQRIAHNKAVTALEKKLSTGSMSPIEFIRKATKICLPKFLSTGDYDQDDRDYEYDAVEEDSQIQQNNNACIICYETIEHRAAYLPCFHANCMFMHCMRSDATYERCAMSVLPCHHY